MREILFRGKIVDSVEWIHGIAFPHDRGSCSILYQFPMDGALEGREVDPDTVGQFTGLYDKDGARIYEGDIVVTELWPGGHFLGAVEWREKDCAFSVRLSENNSTGVSTGCRVVGNIHDDPDMLERKA